MNPPDAFDPAEVAAIRATADALEAYARATDVAPRPGAAANILAAIAAEPTPAPLVAMASSVRARRPARIAAALRDAWRVAWSGPRPVGIRLSSALVVLLLVAVVASGGGMAAAAAWSALQPGPSTPPTPTQLPIVVPPANPSPSVEPTPSAVPTNPTATSGPSLSRSPMSTPQMTPMPTPHPTSMQAPGPTTMPMPTSTLVPMPTHQGQSPMPSHGPAPTHGGMRP